jgi:hypothetical protein
MPFYVCFFDLDAQRPAKDNPFRRQFRISGAGIMYRGFNLSSLSFKNPHGLITRGRSLADLNGVAVKETLDAFIAEGGALDGGQLQENWFPQIHADVFISHSHRDEDLAMALAGWLEEQFELVPFVDSSVWGYADDLLRQIDNRYCLNPGGATYSYKRRNASTSHIHTMLSTALGMMIDSSECLIFLNTPHSVTAKDAVSEKTQSAWLYAEIAMTRVIRRKSTRAHRQVVKYAKTLEEANAGVRIDYPMDLACLTDITGETLIEWQKRHSPLLGHALDTFYEIAG